MPAALPRQPAVSFWSTAVLCGPMPADICCRRSAIGRIGQGGRRAVRAGGEHLLDRLDAAERFLVERPAVGDRADHLVVVAVLGVRHVDGRAAHASQDAGLLQARAAAIGEDHVAAGAGEVPQDIDDLDLELRDGVARHRRDAVADHAGVNPLQRHVAREIKGLARLLGRRLVAARIYSGVDGGQRQQPTPTAGTTKVYSKTSWHSVYCKTTRAKGL